MKSIKWIIITTF
ncbi:hypothetical protein Nmel_016247 [Mimus melanotis]